MAKGCCLRALIAKLVLDKAVISQSSVAAGGPQKGILPKKAFSKRLFQWTQILPMGQLLVNMLRQIYENITML